MPKIQKIGTRKVVSQILKDKKKLQLQKQQEASNLRFEKLLHKTAKEMLKDFPRYELQTNRPDTFQSSVAITPTESLWAPWSKSYRKGHR